MRRLPHVVVLFCVAHMSFARDARAEDACYDVAVIGRIVDSSNFVPPNDLAGNDPNGVYLGGRLDLRVRVSRVLAGDDIPRMIDVRAIMTSLPTRQAVLIFFLKRHYQSPYEAVHWEFAERDARGRYSASSHDDLPVPCRNNVFAPGE